jgi:hypothetical protein
MILVDIPLTIILFEFTFQILKKMTWLENKSLSANNEEPTFMIPLESSEQKFGIVTV